MGIDPAHFRASMPRYHPDDDRWDEEGVGRGLENGMHVVSPISLFWNTKRKDSADILEAPKRARVGGVIYDLHFSEKEIVLCYQGHFGEREEYSCANDPLALMVLIDLLETNRI